jgi:hypothetical protein
MSEAMLYTPENDAVDWSALADQLFPAEALRTAPAFNPLAMIRKASDDGDMCRIRTYVGVSRRIYNPQDSQLD